MNAEPHAVRYPDLMLITSESKWRTYIAAVQPGAVERMPVRAVLRQQHTPVEVIWSP
jgi:6-phosphogluconolactonase